MHPSGAPVPRQHLPLAGREDLAEVGVRGGNVRAKWRRGVFSFGFSLFVLGLFEIKASVSIHQSRPQPPPPTLKERGLEKVSAEALWVKPPGLLGALP